VIRHRVLVPTTLHSAKVEQFYCDQPDVSLEFALAPEHRVYGGGSLGPIEQRRRARAIVEERISEISAVGAMPGGMFLDRRLLRLGTQLRVAFIASVGVDSIDVGAATEEAIPVVHAPGNNAVPVAHHVMGLLLALVRKITLADRLARGANRGLHLSELGPFPGTLDGRTLGLVGAGAVGREVARLASAFGMRVLVVDPAGLSDDLRDLGVELVDDVDELVANVDVVSLHLPLTPATHGLMNERRLRLMRPGSTLVNTARGAIVDTDALCAALDSGHLGGAALDVTEPEPLPLGHRLFGFDNVIITPHAAGASPEAVEAANLTVARSVVQVLRGERPTNLANPDVWTRYLARVTGGLGDG
jgi:D-3-phosphoglycerate dehydrogenase